MAKQELNLLKLTTAGRDTTSHTSCASHEVLYGPIALVDMLRTTYHTTFCERPSPHTFPVLLTARNIFPCVTRAADIHRSRASFAHCGMVAVRMRPPLPNKSTIAQCPWRVCTSSISRSASSDRRSPHPSSLANMA